MSSPLRTIVALLLAVAPSTALTAQADSTARAKVLVIATGRTIAGVQQEPGGIGAYRAGTLTAEQIIASVPPLSRYAQVEAEQFSNVASTLISPDQWLALARRINTVLAERTDLAGVVVTHGTDRLEETAFFLYLTVRSEKPVVVVGAQRPATGLSPDGPVNLLSAVRTVASPQAVGKGVLVVMDDRIISAREVRKQYQRVGGFDGGVSGTPERRGRAGVGIPQRRQHRWGRQCGERRSVRQPSQLAARVVSGRGASRSAPRPPSRDALGAAPHAAEGAHPAHAGAHAHH